MSATDETTRAAGPPIALRRPDGRVLRIAHRGASGLAPENTLRAFGRALEIGVDAIELDVQLSADGELVVIHDDTLERTTDGLGPVSAKTWDELAALDAGSWRGEAFAGERIPRLADVLRQVAGRALVNVEIKGEQDVGTIEPKLAALIEAERATDWVLVSSLQPDAVRNVRAAAPDVALGILWNRRKAGGAFALAEEVGARCLIPGRRWADPTLVARAHDAGLGVWVWTVNDLQEMRQMVAFGVDGIFSDHPERFATLDETLAAAADS